MNKNPERPDDIDEIISECLNPKKKMKTQRTKIAYMVCTKLQILQDIKMSSL